MNRRDFLRRAALVAAGTVAADQVELLDRLGWKRKLFPGWAATPRDVVYFGSVPTSGWTMRLPVDGAVTMEYALLTEPIIGARYTPDIWSQPTITYTR